MNVKIITLLFAAMLVVTTVAHAQPSIPSLDEQFESFVQEYSLTEDQKPAVKSVMEVQRADLKPLLESLQGENDRREKIKILRSVRSAQTKYRDNLAQVLTKEQLEKFDSNKEARKQKLKESIQQAK